MKREQQHNPELSAGTDSPQYAAAAKKKFCIRMIAGLLGGGILGFLCAMGTDKLSAKLGAAGHRLQALLPIIQIDIIPWVMVLMSALCTVYIMGLIRKGKALIDAWDGEDDSHISTADAFLNKASTTTSIEIVLIQILFSIMSYSLMQNLNATKNVILVGVGIAAYFFALFSTLLEQNKIISLIKAYSPEKQGLAYDKNFQGVWLASCDEAEQHFIFEATYKTYQTMNHTFSIFLPATIVVGMFLPIGMLCAILIGILWLIMICRYTEAVSELERGLTPDEE